MIEILQMLIILCLISAFKILIFNIFATRNKHDKCFLYLI